MGETGRLGWLLADKLTRVWHSVGRGRSGSMADKLQKGRVDGHGIGMARHAVASPILHSSHHRRRGSR